jgi:hypothetical protein
MDYLQTTGDRLHDLELDRILARLAALETGAKTTGSAVTTSTVTTLPSAPAVGVRSLSPSGGTPMQDDLVLAVAGPASLTQSVQTLTLTVTVNPATSVTSVGAASTVGTATAFAREDHVHAGVHKIHGSADALGDIVLTGAGVSQTGNTFTFSGSGVAALPTDVLTISPGGTAINWAIPAALTEFNGSSLYRAQHDLTNALQARIVLLLPFPNLAPMAVPTLTAQYSANGGSTWSSLDGTAGPSLAYGAGVMVSGWVALAAGAKAEVLLRLVASGGDGVTSLPFGSVYMQVK